MGTVLVACGRKLQKRIPLHMYKRSGAVCNSSDCEIPLASEESRTSGERSPGYTFTTE